VFFPPPVVPVVREKYGDSHAIAEKKNEDSFYTVLTNLDMERIGKYASRIIQETDNPISKSRSYEQREPYNRNNPAGIQDQT
jgi:hypothetical protein